MIRLLLSLVFGFTCLYSHGQEKHERSLHYYIETAKENSPLIKDYANQTLIQQAELQRLKAMYMHSRLELNGDYLFVPIISKDGGHTAFKWNAQDATDYYGYDLGESSGYFHAGVTWTQPLLGKSSYKAAREQAMINEDLANNHIRVEKHQLERFVTEHYLALPARQNTNPLCRFCRLVARKTDTYRSKIIRKRDGQAVGRASASDRTAIQC